MLDKGWPKRMEGKREGTLVLCFSDRWHIKKVCANSGPLICRENYELLSRRCTKIKSLLIILKQLFISTSGNGKIL